MTKPTDTPAPSPENVMTPRVIAYEVHFSNGFVSEMQTSVPNEPNYIDDRFRAMVAGYLAATPPGTGGAEPPKPDSQRERADANDDFGWACPFCTRVKASSHELKRHIRKHIYRTDAATPPGAGVEPHYGTLREQEQFRVEAEHRGAEVVYGATGVEPSAEPRMTGEQWVRSIFPGTGKDLSQLEIRADIVARSIDSAYDMGAAASRATLEGERDRAKQSLEDVAKEHGRILWDMAALEAENARLRDELAAFAPKESVPQVQTSGPKCKRCGAFTTKTRVRTHGFCMKCEREVKAALSQQKQG